MIHAPARPQPLYREIEAGVEPDDGPRYEPPPCKGCRLEAACAKDKLACGDFRTYVVDFPAWKRAPSTSDLHRWPTRELYREALVPRVGAL